MSGKKRPMAAWETRMQRRDDDIETRPHSNERPGLDVGGETSRPDAYYGLLIALYNALFAG
ncbi:MAG TPA: hypothetical protein VFA78_01110, partial [Chloroflexota bacterium]|nr:hypothetical protein [Chloroflexota bacterium]